MLGFTAPDIGLLHAATRTWSGDAPLSDAWTIADNWSGGIAPVAGDDLVFPGGADRLTNQNDFPAGTSFGSITFEGAGYVVTGNALSPGGITASHLVGVTTFLADLTASNALTLTADAGLPGEGLVVSNLFADNFDVTISGEGDVTIVGELEANAAAGFNKIGSGRLILDSNRNVFFDRAVTIDGGAVWLLQTVTTHFVVNSGGTLRGDGAYVDSLTSNGGTIAPGTDRTYSIRVYDSVVFDSATTLLLRLNSAFSYDALGLSLTTPTTVNLGSSQLELEVGPSVPVGRTFSIVQASNAGSVKVVPASKVALVEHHPHPTPTGDFQDVVSGEGTQSAIGRWSVKSRQHLIGVRLQRGVAALYQLANDGFEGELRRERQCGRGVVVAQELRQLGAGDEFDAFRARQTPREVRLHVVPLLVRQSRRGKRLEHGGRWTSFSHGRFPRTHRPCPRSSRSSRSSA